MMNTQRNWVLALLAIAGCAMFVAAFSVLTTGTDLPEGYGKLSAADSSVKEETVPDIIGEWAQTQDGTTTIYKIAKSEFEAVLDVLRPVDPNLMRFEYQLKWDSNSKAFRGVRVVKRKGFSNPIHISLTSTIRDKGETLATKSEITAESLDVPELKEHTDELRKLYENEVDWARHPAKEAAPPQAADNVHSESVPDLTGRWTATTGGDSPDQQYNVHRIQKPGCFDAFGSINSYECRFQWNPSLKAFHVATSSRTRGIAAIEDNGNTLRIKSSMNPETLAQLMSTFDGGMPEEVVKELRKGLEDLPSDVVWTRQPVPKIAGRWISKGFADGCTIVGGRDEAFYFVYFGSKIGPKDNPDYTMKWDPETKSFEGWVNRLKSTTLGHTPILKFTVEDNENTLHVKFAYDKDTRNRVLESLKQLGMTQQEREALLDQKWARLREDAKPKAEQGNAAPILAEAPFVQIGAPDIAGEWAVSYGGGGTERYKVVPAKSKSDHFVVYATSQGMDKPFLRFQWDSKSNAFVGKLLAGVDEKLQIALRMNMTATVEPDGDAMLVTTSIDPEVLARILKKHGTEAANDASKQCEQETIWTRERMYRVKEAADQDPVPAIGGVWLMGDHGRFGKCNIVRSATEGYAFDVYTLKSVLSSNVSQSGPAYRLKWNSGAKAFEASAQLSNDPKQPGKVSVTMTVEDEGKVLNVKSTPDEAGMKSLESLKQKGIDPDDINQWLNTKWTREKENQQDWTLTDELLGAMSQAKPQGGLTGHALPQAGFGGGAIGGAGGGSAGGFGGGGGLGGGGGRQNNPNPGAGGKNSPNGAGGGDSPNNVPRVGGGAFGRLMDEDPPAAGGGRAFGRLGDEDVGHPPAGGMGLSTKKPAAPVRVESQDILLVETNDGLSAYSKSLGKWAAVKVDRPKDGTARLTRHTVGQQFAFVIIDDQLYGFSSQAAEWDRLSIPPEFFAGLKPVVGMNLLSVVVGDKTYVLSSKTGKWTASDQVPQPASFSTTISSTEIENWRQQQSGKVDSQKLAEEISEREAKAVEIAKQIRKIKSENPHASDDSLEIQKLRADLEKTLTTTFALKSKFESSRVQELQSRVGRLEQQLMRRQTQRTKIIERHLRELIDGEETDWKMEPEKEDNPQSLQTGGGFF